VEELVIESVSGAVAKMCITFGRYLKCPKYFKIKAHISTYISISSSEALLVQI